MSIDKKILDFIDEIFKITEGCSFNYDTETWTIPKGDKYAIINYFIIKVAKEERVIDLVNTFGVFNAINLYQDDYGDFSLDDLTFYKTYVPLAHSIIDNYISATGLLENDDDDDDGIVFQNINLSTDKLIEELKGNSVLKI